MPASASPGHVLHARLSHCVTVSGEPHPTSRPAAQIVQGELLAGPAGTNHDDMELVTQFRGYRVLSSLWLMNGVSLYQNLQARTPDDRVVRRALDAVYEHLGPEPLEGDIFIFDIPEETSPTLARWVFRAMLETCMAFDAASGLFLLSATPEFKEALDFDEPMTRPFVGLPLGDTEWLAVDIVDRLAAAAVETFDRQSSRKSRGR
jgi:hypothetical protein